MIVSWMIVVMCGGKGNVGAIIWGLGVSLVGKGLWGYELCYSCLLVVMKFYIGFDRWLITLDLLS